MLTKIEKNTIQPSDYNLYRGIILEGNASVGKADVVFVSDLQALINEETALIAAFWKDNPILLNGNNLESEMDYYEFSLQKLISENRIPLLDRK